MMPELTVSDVTVRRPKALPVDVTADEQLIGLVCLASDGTTFRGSPRR